ncbi:MAG: ABC transporter substrate-binding protein [Clostridiales bacterium]|nr:ABC transporter substrate-binding protein [Clostridiales bacterium]
MKKIILLLSFMAITMAFIGCGKDEGEKLYVYNWGEYMDPEVRELFEEETGIKIVYEEFETNEEMFPKIKTNAVQYDLICPSDYMIQKMAGEGLLAEINFDNVPNIKHIAPDLLESSETFDPGNRYSVPYAWGTVGILYNKTMVDEPIDSWGVLFDGKYSGEILMIDSVRDAFAVALKYLGYDLNSTNEIELNEAQAILKAQYPLVQAYVVDQVRDKMIGGEAALGVIYSGEAIYTKRENPDLEYVVPKEGSNVWIDSWVIPKNAPNKENAEKFINFLCKPEIALMNFEYITYSTPNVEARNMIEDEDIKNSPIAFPDEETLERTTAFQYLGEEVESMYVEKWNDVKSNIE